MLKEKNLVNEKWTDEQNMGKVWCEGMLMFF